MLGRLNGLSSAFPGGAGNVGWAFGRNPASQIVTETRSNDAYAYGGSVAVNRNYAVNGLNQYTTAGTASLTHDANGNLTGDGTITYVYDAENRLVSASNGTALTYDPLGRLWQVVKGAANTRFLTDGDALVAEYDGAGALTARYVHGSSAAADDPLVWYQGATTRWLHANYQGSIVAVTNGAGGSPSINSYDEYGVPGSTNQGRFQYTGQAWLAELGMYYYKARIYSQMLGRFLQVDPVGYDDQINLYAYVGSDPMNRMDPSGLAGFDQQDCTGSRLCSGPGLASGVSGSSTVSPTGRAEAASSQAGTGRSGYVLDGDTAMTRAMSRDDQDYLTDKISEDELMDRRNARGLGVAAGTAVLATGVVAAESGAVTAVTTAVRGGASRVAQSAFQRGGWLNNNRFVRFGENFKMTGRVQGKPVGENLFRIVVGRGNAYNVFGYKIRIHKHWDVGRWPW